jgi:hypothetical protein
MRAAKARRQRRGALLAGLTHALSQCLRAASLFVGSDLLFHSAVPLPLFACAVLAVSAAALGAAYRPPLRCLAQHAAPILWSGLASAASVCLWGYGLAHCGPLRTILFDHCELPLLYLLPFLTRRPSPIPRSQKSRRLRGALVLFLAYALLLRTHGMHHRHGVGGRGGVAFYEGAPPVSDTQGTPPASILGEPVSLLGVPVSIPGESSSIPGERASILGEQASISKKYASTSNRRRYLESASGFFDSALSLADSISGELALLFSGVLSAAQAAATRRLAATVGRNRLHALTYGCGALLCAPAAALACVRAGAAASALSVATAPAGIGILAVAILGRVVPAQTAAAAAAWHGPKHSAVGGLVIAAAAAAALDMARGAVTGAASATPLMGGCAGMAVYGVWAMHDGAPP